MQIQDPTEDFTAVRCSHGACVEARDGVPALDADGAVVLGVMLTSNLPHNDERLIVTQQEFNDFVARVKAGIFDRLVRPLPVTV